MKRLLVALGMCLVAGVASAQDEVLFCTINHDNGYRKVENQYRPTKFNEDRFTMQIKGDRLEVSYNGDKEYYKCDTVFPSDNKLACSSTLTGYHLNYNKENGKFIRVEAYGYVFGDSDTVSMSIGTCSNF